MPDTHNKAKYDVFIICSRKDCLAEDGVNPVAELLEFLGSHGISYWIDKADIYSGAEFAEQITTAISESKMVIFVSSKYSNASVWTAAEIFEAFDRNKLIIPFRIDDTPYSSKFSFLLRPLDHIDFFHDSDSSFYALLNIIESEMMNYERISDFEGSGAFNGYDYVNLDLPSGTLWATCNVGASSPADYGDYFAWGETSPKEWYAWENLKYRIGGTFYADVKFSKYVSVPSRGNVDGKTVLELQDDAAFVSRGGIWRMPDKSEWQELKDHCDWKWTKEDGHYGYKVTGRNGAGIFLPAAGWRNGDSMYHAGVAGNYWTSGLFPDDSYQGFACNFDSGIVFPSAWVSRCSGLSIRPVASPLLSR